MSVPVLTTEQRRNALAKAAAARQERAELKQQIKQGKVSLPKVLELAEKNEAIAKLRVFELLQSLPGIGKVKAEVLMAKLNISASRRVKGLGPKQTAALLAECARD